MVSEKREKENVFAGSKRPKVAVSILMGKNCTHKLNETSPQIQIIQQMQNKRFTKFRDQMEFMQFTVQCTLFRLIHRDFV